MSKDKDFELLHDEPFQDRNWREGVFVKKTYMASPFTADLVDERWLHYGVPTRFLLDPPSFPDISEMAPTLTGGDEPDPWKILPWNRKKDGF